MVRNFQPEMSTCWEGTGAKRNNRLTEIHKWTCERMIRSKANECEGFKNIKIQLFVVVVIVYFTHMREVREHIRGGLMDCTHDRPAMLR